MARERAWSWRRYNECSWGVEGDVSRENYWSLCDRYLWIKKRQNLSAKTPCNFCNTICSAIFIIESGD
jgi:hypothetical protein